MLPFSAYLLVECTQLVCLIPPLNTGYHFRASAVNCGKSCTFSASERTYHLSVLSDLTTALHSSLCSEAFPLHTRVEPAIIKSQQYRTCLYGFQAHIQILITVNPLAPNDLYISLTAQLTSRRCILNIYSTNILTEYFKHAAHSPFFFSFKMPFIS